MNDLQIHKHMANMQAVQALKIMQKLDLLHEEMAVETDDAAYLALEQKEMMYLNDWSAASISAKHHKKMIEKYEGGK